METGWQIRKLKGSGKVEGMAKSNRMTDLPISTLNLRCTPNCNNRTKNGVSQLQTMRESLAYHPMCVPTPVAPHVCVNPRSTPCVCHPL
eukprot:jgi/Botrbrau1/19463/Bobra.0338s0083.1